VLPKISQPATLVVLAQRNNMIKKKVGLPTYQKWMTRLKGMRWRIDEEFSHDMKLEDEDYEVEASRFNFHEVQFLF
jgi:hypothetical protein